MDQILDELLFKTPGEGFLDITSEINQWIIKKKIIKGILILSSLHTSCSLTINENADPRVLEDLSAYIKAIVPEEGFKSIDRENRYNTYSHNDEGVDDMPAHIRTTLTCSSLSLSIENQNLNLGIWQAVYLWEHRYCRHTRRLHLHAIGEVEQEDVSS